MNDTEIIFCDRCGLLTADCKCAPDAQTAVQWTREGTAPAAESPTPRTDARQKAINNDGYYTTHPAVAGALSLARQLERENAALREEINAIKGRLEIVDRYRKEAQESLSRQNANYGKDVADYEQENQQLREEIKLVRRHLADANRGAECNAKVNWMLTGEVAKLKKELDEIGHAIKAHDEMEELLLKWQTVARELATVLERFQAGLNGNGWGICGTYKISQAQFSDKDAELTDAALATFNKLNTP